jgi:hypothetical protein
VKDRPLSPAQRGIWLAVQARNEAALYHCNFLWEIRGEISVSRLQVALDALLARHPHLCDGVMMKRDQPVLFEPSRFSIEIESVNVRDDADCRKRAWDVVQRPFLLTKPPLLRVVVYRFPAHQTRLLLVAHHLVLDGGSAPRFLEEWLAFYSGLAPSCAPRANASPHRQADFWVGRLSFEPIELPLDFDRAPEPRSQSGDYSLVLENVPLWQELVKSVLTPIWW